MPFSRIRYSSPCIYLRNRFAGVPKIYWTLSSVSFLFYFAVATGSYLTVFLQKSGFSPLQVGAINSVNFAVSICATPFWGIMADKVQSNRKIIIYCMAIASLLWTLVPVTSRIPLGPIYMMNLLIPVCSFFRMPAQSLMDAFFVQTCAKEGVGYGGVRLWGSISFAIMSISLSAILPWTGVEVSFYMYGVAFIPLLIILSRIKDTANGDTARKSIPFREMQFDRLLKEYYFITYMVFAVFMHMPVNTSMTFLPYLVDMVGGDTAQFGLITGYKALLEVPMLLIITPLRNRFPLPVAVILSGILYAVEFSLYSYATGLYQILALQTLHGLAGGLMIGASTNYVYTMAPKGLNSTAHTVNGAMNSFAAIIGNVLGGVLITMIGVREFYAVLARIIICAIVYFIATLTVGTKVLRKPIPRSV